MLAPGIVQAQFSSGSNNSDGALNLTTAGTVIFDPAAMGLNPAGDNVFNFTTINIGAGVTVIMKAGALRNRSVVWLASGAVTIAGTLNLSGTDGAIMNASNPGLNRSPAEPGPGGFPGGVGAYLNSPATAGGGFGGGAAGTASNGGTGSGGVYSYFNSQLTPLLGGAGGGGGWKGTGTAGGNGGAGGGAIRIVSSTSINVTGHILAAYGFPNGPIGPGFNGGLASGGVIHLIAPSITGNGEVNTGNGGSSGVVKLSGSNINQTFFTGFGGNVVIGGLYNPPLPSGVPVVSVVSVNGVAAPANPLASYLVPDVTINAATTVTVNIAAQNIPVGTVVNLSLTSEQGNDSIVTCAPLAGSIANSSASCSGASYPPGITITNIRATW